MRVYIATDMEGVAGVVHRDHTHPGGQDYERARHWLTAEVNAAIQGAIEGGAEFVLVEDGHGNCRNIIREELHPAAQLIMGQMSSLPPSAVVGLDGSFDAVALIGYHARAQTPQANLDHTSWSQTVREVRLNGRPAGETAINAAYAGAFGVPVVCVSGDDKLESEVQEWLPQTPTAVVKRAFGRYVAQLPSHEEAHALIQETMKRGLDNRNNKIKPFQFDGEITIELDFLHSLYADLAEMVPLCKRVGPETIAYTSDDYLSIHRVFSVMCATSAVALFANPR